MRRPDQTPDRARLAIGKNAYAARVIGTTRRKCLDQKIPLEEQHLRRTVERYVGYYNGFRTHLSLEKVAPNGRPLSSWILAASFCVGVVAFCVTSTTVEREGHLGSRRLVIYGRRRGRRKS
jgi:hypothetical protein